MSEKIYGLLLRLYPSHFREAYGDEALQLFRDRARDEKRFFATLRLWVDLLGDLLISVPREWRHVQPTLVGARVHCYRDSTPSFEFVEGESPRPGALLTGGVFSLVALWAISVLLAQVENYGPRVALVAQSQRFAYADFSALTGESEGPGSDAEEEAITASRMAKPVSRLSPGDATVSHLLSNLLPRPNVFGFLQPQSQQLRPRGAASAMILPVARDARLDAAERQRVIDAVIANLKEHYVYPDVAQKMADALVAHEKNGDDNAVTDGRASAGLLTRQIRDMSHDMHLEVVYSQTPLPDRSTGPTPERFARYRKAMEENNCTFEKVQVLPRSIGYLKLNSFPDPSICESAARAAMASLNDAGAIIFDLRDNHGGYPGMNMLIAAYLFDHPEYMYSPRENTTELSWTRSPVPGNKLADKPVYVLTSARTFSAAEHFSYNLKMLKRATLVGETTGGATDVGIFHRLDDHFGIGIRETRPINPYSEPDWAVAGVQPDVKVKAADAPVTAEKLAESKLKKK